MHFIGPKTQEQRTETQIEAEEWQDRAVVWETLG